MKNKTTFLPLFAAVILLGTALTACGSKSIVLEGTSWKAIEINGEPTLEDYAITMDFTVDQIGGKASCNSYFASYTLKGDKLSIGPAGTTLMACLDQAAMNQEHLFLTSLDKVETVSLENGQLVLHLGDGGSILLIQQ